MLTYKQWFEIDAALREHIYNSATEAEHACWCRITAAFLRYAFAQWRTSTREEPKNG